MPFADPLQRPEFGGTHGELSQIAAYRKAISELKAGQPGGSRPTQSQSSAQPAQKEVAADEAAGGAEEVPGKKGPRRRKKTPP